MTKIAKHVFETATQALNEFKNFDKCGEAAQMIAENNKTLII